MQAHEVPTHLQAEDRVLIGLTFPQIVAAASVIGLAYGLFRYASFLPQGHFRIAAAVLLAGLGLAFVLVRPGGRALPVVLSDLLRYFLMPKRYEGTFADLLDPQPRAPRIEKTADRKKRATATGKRTRRRFHTDGTLFRCVGLVLVVAVFLASLGPKVVSADPSGTSSDVQRVFIERWKIRDGQAIIAVRAGASVEVRVTAETEGGRQTFAAQDVFFRGERRDYVVPLASDHQSVAISWRDAHGAAGIRVLDRASLPYPLPRLEGADCTVFMTELSWQQENLSGRVASTCRTSATETVEAVVLEDPNDPTRTVRQKLVVDAAVEQISGSLKLASGFRDSLIPLSRKTSAELSLPVPASGGVLSASLEVDLLSTRVAELPGRVELKKHPEKKVTRKIPVVAWFEGFTTSVSSVLSATWEASVVTVSERFFAWFEPVTRTLSATLQATWDSFYETVGADVSATVSRWVSAVVGTEVWTTVGHWLNTTVGTWVSTIVGTFVFASVGAWLTRTVGTTVTAIVGTKVWTDVSAWLTTTVGVWLSTTVAAQVSAMVGTWVSTTVGRVVSATVGTHVSTYVSALLSANVGTWVSAIVGTNVFASVGTWLTASVGTWVSTSVGVWLTATVGTWVSTWVGGFYSTVTAWAGVVLGWLNISAWVPSQQASGYASGTASGYASGQASGYASGIASGYASGTASGYASGQASGYASGTASGYALGRAEGYATGEASGWASGTASDYASGTATGQASGTATGYASGTAGGLASGRAEGFASGEASAYASGTATEYATGTASGFASGPATGYATGEATGYAEGRAYGYATAEATGYAEGTATGYASKRILVPGRTGSKTVNESVTMPGQMREQIVSRDLEIPGRVVEREVTKGVDVLGREVVQEVDVEVVIPGYVSADVVRREPLVRHYQERLSVTFPVFSDAPYAAAPEREAEGGGQKSTPVDDYVKLLDEQKDKDGNKDGKKDRPKNPYRDALDGIDGNFYFLDHPDEAALLRSALFLRWIDSLSIPFEAKAVMQREAGGVTSGKNYSLDELPAAAVKAKDLFQDLVGAELR